MKTVHVIAGSPDYGGAHSHICTLASGLIERGHESTVVSGPPNPLFLRMLRDRSVPCEVLPHLRRSISPLTNARALASLVSLLRTQGPDVVAAHCGRAGLFAALAAGVLRIPVVYTPHGFTLRLGTGGVPNWLLRKSRMRVIAVSRGEQRHLEAATLAPKERIFLVPSGVPDVSDHARPIRELRVIMTARFQHPKDHETLLSALSQLPDYPWTLQLVGAGPLLPRSIETAKQYGIADRVSFLGERADIPALLAGSSIFVLSTRREAFPVSILEAMRAALPVVASCVAGAEDAIRHGFNGFLVPVGQPGELAKHLRMLFEDHSLRERFGRNARLTYLMSFTDYSMTNRTLDIYERAAQSGAA